MPIAFFDLDGTLTAHDTLFSFARHSVGRVRLLRALLLSLPAITKWKLGLASNSVAKETLFRHLYKGMPLSEFEAKAETFADIIEADLLPLGKARLTEHMGRGDEVAIVSASIGGWIRPWARRYGIETVISTEAETDSHGRLTGRFSTPNCHGEEKVRRIRERYPDLNSRRVFAYGDSPSDAPMIALSARSKK